LSLNAFDSHAHLDLEQFDSDREEVIGRALKAGVSKINTVGINAEASRRSIALAERYPSIVASVGIHPQEAHLAAPEDLAAFAQLAAHPRVVAIGETGLDFYHDDAPRDAQLRILAWQLELAAKLRLPVIIHARQAQEEIKNILKGWSGGYRTSGGRAKGVIHCFSGDLAAAEFFIELGFFISVGAYIGYPSSSRFRETLRQIPLNRLLVETDCPFLPPQRMRGQRNEPSYLPMTLAILAEVKSIAIEEAAQCTTANAESLFSLKNTG
jgi:TatD DNase family protein